MSEQQGNSGRHLSDDASSVAGAFSESLPEDDRLESSIPEDQSQEDVDFVEMTGVTNEDIEVEEDMALEPEAPAKPAGPLTDDELERAFAALEKAPPSAPAKGRVFTPEEVQSAMEANKREAQETEDLGLLSDEELDSVMRQREAMLAQGETPALNDEAAASLEDDILDLGVEDEAPDAPGAGAQSSVSQADLRAFIDEQSEEGSARASADYADIEALMAQLDQGDETPGGEAPSEDETLDEADESEASEHAGQNRRSVEELMAIVEDEGATPPDAAPEDALADLEQAEDLLRRLDEPDEPPGGAEPPSPPAVEAGEDEPDGAEAPAPREAEPPGEDLDAALEAAWDVEELGGEETSAAEPEGEGEAAAAWDELEALAGELAKPEAASQQPGPPPEALEESDDAAEAWNELEAAIEAEDARAATAPMRETGDDWGSLDEEVAADETDDDIRSLLEAESSFEAAAREEEERPGAAPGEDAMTAASESPDDLEESEAPEKDAGQASYAAPGADADIGHHAPRESSVAPEEAPADTAPPPDAAVRDAEPLRLDDEPTPAPKPRRRKGGKKRKKRGRGSKRRRGRVAAALALAAFAMAGGAAFWYFGGMAWARAAAASAGELFQPADPRARGARLAAEQRFLDAAAAYETAAEQADAPTVQAGALLAAGLAYESAARRADDPALLDKARGAGQKALETAPNADLRARARLLLARAALAQDKPGHALEVLAAQEKRPQGIEALAAARLEARALLAADRPTDALDAASRALEHRANYHPDLDHEARARAYLALSQTEANDAVRRLSAAVAETEAALSAPGLTQERRSELRAFREVALERLQLAGQD